MAEEKATARIGDAMNGRFVYGGCCVLDFFLCWTEDAIRDRNADRAYQNARLLAHWIFALQPELRGSERP